MTDKKSSESRRKLLKSIAAGGGAIVAGKSLPENWTRPIVDSVVLPAHAQTSPGECVESIVYTNTIDAGTGFIISATWLTHYLDSTSFGYSPTAGSTSLHSNNIEPGLAYLPLPNSLVPGTYTIELDVGNYNNAPFVTITDIGLRSGGAFITPSASSTPTPASGEQLTWSFTYDLSAGDIASLDFAVDVPFSVTNANGSYDNLIMSKVCP